MSSMIRKGDFDDEVFVFSTIGQGPKGEKGDPGVVTYPRFADPLDWSRGRDYDQYVVVLNEGRSYISKVPVPHGVNITDIRYWALTNDYNAQVEKVSMSIVHAFDTVADMQASNDLKAGMTCHTNGFHSPGGSGGAFYKVGTTGTPDGMNVIALQGGLVATLVQNELTQKIVQNVSFTFNNTEEIAEAQSIDIGTLASTNILAFVNIYTSNPVDAWATISGTTAYLHARRVVTPDSTTETITGVLTIIAI